MRGVEFHRLAVAEVEQLTEQAVAVSLAVPPELRESFGFLPGQHVTLRAFIDGADVRRSYSICSPPDSPNLRVGIKRLEGGAFSTYATTRLKVGDVLEATPPAGEFTITPEPRSSRHLCAIAAGSGITPILSIATSLLEGEPNSHFSLVLGNKAARSIMFLEDLAGLKDRFPSRFHMIHVLSQEGSQLPLLSGRIDGPKLTALFGALIDPMGIEAFYLCGPLQMVETTRTLLESWNIPRSRVRDELFFAGSLDEAPPPAPAPRGPGSVELTVTLDGRTTTTSMRREDSILDAALAVRHELPFSCKGGMCATCKGRLVAGEVTMDKNYALIDDELDAGFVLTCQAHPRSDVIEIDYDV